MRAACCTALLLLASPALAATTPSLAGWTCPSQPLPSPAPLPAAANTLADLCPDLSLAVDTAEIEEGEEEAVQVVVEAAAWPVPGSGQQLLAQQLPLAAAGLDQQLRDITVAALGTQCGLIHLVASLTSADGESLEFRSLALSLPCSDLPGLALRVERRADTVQGPLYRATTNPFSVIGVSGVAVVNQAENCSAAASGPQCADQTAFQPRRAAPDIVAFFVPLSWRDTAPEDNSSLFHSVGLRNGTGSGWFSQEPQAMQAADISSCNWQRTILTHCPLTHRNSASNVAGRQTLSALSTR